MDTPLLNTLGAVACSIVLLVIGLFFLIRPGQVQGFYLNLPDRLKRPDLNPFHEWMKTGSYRLSVRFCGVVALLMALVLLWGTGR